MQPHDAPATTELRREEVYRIIDRHHGEQSRLAARLERSRTTVSQVLRGRATSKLILEAARERAAELLAAEQEAAAREEREGKAA